MNVDQNILPTADTHQFYFDNDPAEQQSIPKPQYSIPNEYKSQFNTLDHQLINSASFILNSVTEARSQPYSSHLDENDKVDEVITDSNNGNLSDDLSDISVEDNENSQRRILDRTKSKEKKKINHQMLPPCRENCQKKCYEKITEGDRINIWNSYWAMDNQRRQDFISRCVVKSKVKARTSDPATSRRNSTLLWKLNEIKVCKMMFLYTIGYKNDQVVRAIFNSKLKISSESGLEAVSICSAGPDMRGHHKPPHAFDKNYKDEIIKFVESFQPVPSHYNLKHAPNRRYLPIGLTFTDIHSRFNAMKSVKKEKKCSWPYFHSILKTMNLSKANPSQDDCTKCTEHDIAHPKTSQIEKGPENFSVNVPDKTINIHECDKCNCKQCEDFVQHRINKTVFRNHLHEQQEICKNSNRKQAIFTVDMQKVILMPKLSTKDYFFSSKLVLFNETFAAPGSNQPSFCLLWHEGESGRNAFNIATTYVLFLKKYCQDVEKVTFFVDNCNAQNKNKILYSALLRYINNVDNKITKTIKIEYFEPGHSYMTADSIHAAITKKINKSPDLYDFDDFVRIISESHKNLQVYELNHSDFIIFDNELKLKTPVPNFNVQKLKIVEFRRGYSDIFAKNDYNQQNFTSLHFCNKKFQNILTTTIKESFSKDILVDVPRQEAPRGISSEKKAALLKLTSCMPQSRRKFYDDLVVTENIVDLDNETSTDI